MRTAADVKKLRDIISDQFGKTTNQQQRTMLAGMSAALQWVCGQGQTCQMLFDGKPVQPVPEGHEVDFDALMERFYDRK